MSKSLETRKTILDGALGLARKVGFEALSIGELATHVGMSKSGLFAHFKSKEALQIQILDHAAEQFVQNVTLKAIKSPRGVKRLNAFVNHWIKWGLEDLNGSCPLVAASFEFDDRPGAVLDKVKELLVDLHHTIRRTCQICIEEGDFQSDLDADQFAQELFSYILSFQLYKKTLGDRKARARFKTSVDSLIQRSMRVH